MYLIFSHEFKAIMLSIVYLFTIRTRYSKLLSIHFFVISILLNIILQELKFLPMSFMRHALTDYVQKEDGDALGEALNKTLKLSQVYSR